jgi:GNAT superfamily N-acetyltransferase
LKALVIREAHPGDEDAIHAMLLEFAEFEKLTPLFKLTPEIIARDFMGTHARVQCEVAEWEGAIAGLMICSPGYGTFSAAPVIFIEDIFVLPKFRRRGIGKAFLKRLAQRAVVEGVKRVHWIVLDWNMHAIEFYKSIGAAVADEWRVCNLSGEALARLAQL